MVGRYLTTLSLFPCGSVSVERKEVKEGGENAP